MTNRQAIRDDYRRTLDSVLGPEIDVWDANSCIPEDVLQHLGTAGLLCPQVPSQYGGLGCNSEESGEITAHVGSRCSSIRSIMTSQGMAAWAIQRLGDGQQRAELMPPLTAGKLAAVAFTEVDAGSDLSAIATSVRRDGTNIELTGNKVWVTGARYADVLIVVGRLDNGEAVAVAVPTATQGVQINLISQPLGCRAAGHADVRLEGVRLPFTAVLGGCSYAMSTLVTTALTFGRLSVAWGCVGILRGCLQTASAHARDRSQFGRVIADNQLVLRHLAQLVVLESVASRACERASQSWDLSHSSVAFDSVLAKYVSSKAAADGATRAVQILASAGARNSHLVARAYRDAKIMEIIEGSSEICELLLADYALEFVGSRGDAL